jgi:hypothetical protein
VVRKNHTTALVKGQSLSMSATDANDENVARVPDSDEFDRWVSGRVDSAVTATNAGLQYANNSSSYSSGLGDLYTYGSWSPVSGYGYGWRPYGVGLGWSPFDSGGWFQDSAFGWGFIGNQPWGWLPYHYGGWVFEPGFGWIWLPGNFGSVGFTNWRPATATWVHSRTGTVGIVPSHPLDISGKAPVNLVHGVFPVSNGMVAARAVPSSSDTWKVDKSPARGMLANSLTASSRPETVSRTTLSGGSGNRIVSIGPDSGITYDAHEHRFVNSDSASSRARSATVAGADENAQSSETRKSPTGATGVARAAGKTSTTATPASAARSNEPVAPRRTLTPPPAASARSAGGNATLGAEQRSSSGSSRAASAPASSSGRSSTPSGSSGGRPH